MRCEQYIGLNDWAQNYVCATVKAREIGVRLLPDGSTETFDREVSVPVARRETVGAIAGAYGQDMPLTRYTMPNGRVFTEYVQAAPWSSGPCYFIALRNERGNVVTQSLWRQEDIDRV